MTHVGMKYRGMRVCAPVAALVLLAACGGAGGAANADANAAVNDAAVTVNVAAPVANEAAPAAAPAAAGSTALSADYMVGKWSAIGEDCSATIEFHKDGTVDTPIGTAKWKVEADKLSFDYGDGSKPTVSTIKVLSPERIEILRASGGKETEKRC